MPLDCSTRTLDQNCVLLFIEASVPTILVAGFLTYLVGSGFYSRNALLIHFGIISGVSVAALAFGIFAAAASIKRPVCIRLWRGIFHAPFLFQMYLRWPDRQQVQLEGTFSLCVVNSQVIIFSSLLGIPFHLFLAAAAFHFLIDHIYHNMMLAATRETDEAGLVVTQHIYRWIEKGISRIRTSRRRQHHQRPDSSSWPLAYIGRFITEISHSVCLDCHGLVT